MANFLSEFFDKDIALCTRRRFFSWYSLQRLYSDEENWFHKRECVVPIVVLAETLRPLYQQSDDIEVAPSIQQPTICWHDGELGRGSLDIFLCSYTTSLSLHLHWVLSIHTSNPRVCWVFAQMIWGDCIWGSWSVGSPPPQLISVEPVLTYDMLYLQIDSNRFSAIAPVNLVIYGIAQQRINGNITRRVWCT